MRGGVRDAVLCCKKLLELVTKEKKAPRDYTNCDSIKHFTTHVFVSVINTVGNTDNKSIKAK